MDGDLPRYGLSSSFEIEKFHSFNDDLRDFSKSIEIRKDMLTALQKWIDSTSLLNKKQLFVKFSGDILNTIVKILNNGNEDMDEQLVALSLSEIIKIYMSECEEQYKISLFISICSALDACHDCNYFTLYRDHVSLKDAAAVRTESVKNLISCLPKTGL
jgi:hypothetical protein